MTYADMEDWATNQLDEWGEWLEPDEMREYLEENFHGGGNQNTWDNITGLIDDYYSNSRLRDD